MNNDRTLGPALAAGVFILIVAGILPCFGQRTPNSDERPYRAEVTAHAKKYLVSDIDSEMPHVTIEAWLQGVTGTRGTVVWKQYGCTPTGAVHIEGERPWVSMACIDASIRIASEYFLHVSMEFGKLEPEVPTKPSLRDISVSDDSDNELASVRSWSEVPALVRSIQGSVSFVDPNHGQFTISGTPPAGFEGLSLYFRTIEFAEYFTAKNGGEIETDDRRHFVLTNILFDGRNFSFKTTETGGVSYRFVGRFVRSNTAGTDLSGDIRRILHGRFTKFVKGREVKSAYLYFDLYPLGDIG